LKKVLFILTLVVGLSLLLSSAFAEEPKYGGTLVFARGGDSVRLDPADITDGESVKACNNIYDTLVKYKEESTEVEPSLATSWETSEDGTTWIFHLREGVKFHDGTPFNAEAVVISLERQLKEDHPYHFEGSDFAYWGYMYPDVESVSAVDDMTVKITLKGPNASFLSNMAMFPVSIVSPAALEKYGIDIGTHPVGTGAFKFVEWIRDDRIVLEANEDYWAGRPYLDKLIIKSIPDNTVRWLELRTGSVDCIDGINPDDIAYIQRDANLELLQQPGMNVGYLAMNFDMPPFENKLVRKAVNHAVNKKALIDALYQGFAIPAKNPMPPVLWGYNDNIQDYEYDPDKARELLAEAGFPDGFDTTLWAMPVPRPYMPQPMKIAEVIQADLKKVGINARIVTYEWGTYLEKTENGEHDMCLLGWIGDNGDPDNFIYVLLDKDNAVKGTAGNVSFYRSDELHDVLIKAIRTFDQAERAKLYMKAQEIVHEDAPWVPLAHATNVAAVKKTVRNLHLHPTGNWWFNEVWIK